MRLRLLTIKLAAVAAPLIYYSLLGRLDSAWAQSARVNQIAFAFPWPTLVAVLAPLGITAALCYRLPLRSFEDLTVRIWPIAALAVLGIIEVTGIGTYSSHALQGLSIPVAVLAVRGSAYLIGRWRPPLKLIIGVTLVGILLVPSLVDELNTARTIGQPNLFGGHEPYFITADEQDALRFIKDSPLPGAVLASVYLGQIVPATTQ